MKNKNTEPSLLIIDQNGVIGSITASQLFKDVRLEHASVLSSDISLDMNSDMKMKMNVKKDDVVNVHEKMNVKLKDNKLEKMSGDKKSDNDNKNDDNDNESSKEGDKESDDGTGSVGESIVVANEKVI